MVVMQWKVSEGIVIVIVIVLVLVIVLEFNPNRDESVKV
jgi:hypothetical protein